MPPGREHWRTAAAAFLGGVFAALLAFALSWVPWDATPVPAFLRLLSSPDRMEAMIRSWGPAGPFASVALMTLHSFVPFPAEILAVANGMLFGLVVGTAVTWAGAMLGGIAAFALARLVGQRIVMRLVGEGQRATVERWTRRTGPQALLLARLVPVISFNLVNYAAGLAGVGWWTFLWTTALGILPITVVSVLVGSHMTDASWELWTLLGVALVLVAVVHWRRRGARDE